jgi:hypothetical protein
MTGFNRRQRVGKKDGDLNLTTKAQRWILNKLVIEAPRAGFVGFARWLLGLSLGQVPPAPGRSPAPIPGERATSVLMFDWGRGRERLGRLWAMNLPGLWHRLRGAGVATAPPEVSAIAATSGYYLPTPFGLKKGEEESE